MKTSTLPPNRISNYHDIVRFLFAGYATFTLLDTRINERITYFVKQAEDNGKKKDMWFVSARVGMDFLYFGYIDKDKKFNWAKTPKLSKDDLRAKYFLAFLIRVNQEQVPNFIEFWHEGICGKCGRHLTVPESINNGLGPVCRKRMIESESKPLNPRIPNPLQLQLV